MNEWAESLLKKIQENEKILEKLEPHLEATKERLVLYRKLYELETGKEAMQQDKSVRQLDMPLVKKKRKPFEKAGRLSIAEATVRMLKESKGPLHGKDIFKKLPAYGASAKNLNTVWGTLSNKPKLFKNVGNNRWILRKYAPLE